MEWRLSTAVGCLRWVGGPIAAAVVGFGVRATPSPYVPPLTGVRASPNNGVRLYPGPSLPLGREFQLGADILSTALAPTLDDVILLGAIAAIRTVLNYFLSQELERERREVASRPEREATSSA